MGFVVVWNLLLMVVVGNSPCFEVCFVGTLEVGVSEIVELVELALLELALVVDFACMVNVSWWWALVFGKLGFVETFFSALRLPQPVLLCSQQ